MFLDGPGAKARDAVHVIFAGEKVRTNSPRPSPDLEITGDPERLPDPAPGSLVFKAHVVPRQGSDPRAGLHRGRPDRRLAGPIPAQLGGACNTCSRHARGVSLAFSRGAEIKGTFYLSEWMIRLYVVQRFHPRRTAAWLGLDVIEGGHSSTEVELAKRPRSSWNIRSRLPGGCSASSRQSRSETRREASPERRRAGSRPWTGASVALPRRSVQLLVSVADAMLA